MKALMLWILLLLFGCLVVLMKIRSAIAASQKTLMRIHFEHDRGNYWAEQCHNQLDAANQTLNEIQDDLREGLHDVEQTVQDALSPVDTDIDVDGP